MPKFDSQLILRLARLVMPLGKGEAAAETISEVFSALPPEEEPMIQFRIPIEMIRAALERKRKQERGQRLLPAPRLKKPSGVRFTLPLMRVAIPLSPRNETEALKTPVESCPPPPTADFGGRTRTIVASEKNSSESPTINLLLTPTRVMNVLTARDKPRVQGDARMATFSINDENNISVWENAEQAAKVADSTATFQSQAELTGISTEWPLSRFVDIWNSIPGQVQVHKFSDRRKAVARIWRAIQPLAPQGEPSTSKAEPLPKKSLRVDTKTRTPQKKRSTPKKNTGNSAGRVNKKAAVIAMMKRAKGATLPEIMQATSWQAHTVRGFISILGSKGGHKIESTKNAAGERTYRAAK